MSKEPYLVVTPEQYKKGYHVFLGGVKPYALIKKLDNGNYLVKDPGQSEKAA